LPNVPFFIVGSGRSGTTLLRLLLCGHPRLHIPPETWYVATLVRTLPLRARLTPAEVRQAVGIMLAEYRWPDLRIADSDLRAWAEGLPAPRLVDIIDLPYRHLLARAGKARWGDKTPPYIAIVPQLAALYPGARFIHLIRDGRDVALSFSDAGLACRPWQGRRFEWTAAIGHARAWRGTPYAADMLELRYEELARTPEAALRRVCDFLGESFDPAMLDHRARTGLVPARERRIHARLGQPISDAGVASWRGRLSAVECFILEASLHDDLRRLGYALRFAGAYWRPALAATGWLLRALAPLLDRGLPALRRRGLLPRG